MLRLIWLAGSSCVCVSPPTPSSARAFPRGAAAGRWVYTGAGWLGRSAQKGDPSALARSQRSRRRPISHESGSYGKWRGGEREGAVKKGAVRVKAKKSALSFGYYRQKQVGSNLPSSLSRLPRRGTTSYGCARVSSPSPVKRRWPQPAGR